MTSPEPPAGTDDEMDRWIDELAGRRPPADPAVQELRTVVADHKAVRTQRLLGNEASPQAQRRATEALRERLRTLPQPEPRLAESGRPAVFRPPGGGASNDRRWRWVAGLSVLMLGAGILWQLRPSDEASFAIASSGAPMWRDLREPVRLAVDNPTKAAQTLAREVAPFDSRPLLYREGDAILVDFEVAPSRVEEMTRAISESRLRSGVRAGSNRVVFARTP